MSNRAYDFLTESFLFRENDIADNFSKYNDDLLVNELTKYRNCIEGNLQVINEEIISNKNYLNTSIESFGNLPSEEMLKQLALYVDTVVFEDPLIKYSEVKSNFREPMNKLLGFTELGNLDRDQLVTELKYLKNNADLVAKKYLKLYPISLMHEAPKNIPLYYSENNFSDSLPPEIMKFFHERAKISNIERLNGKLSYNPNKPLRVGTTIYVSFDEAELHQAMMYQFMTSEVIEIKDGSNEFTSRYYIPDHISKDEFINWVNHSINRAAIHVFEDTQKELYLAKSMNCTYLAQSRLTSDLLNVSYGKNDVKSDLANLSMLIDLPICRELSLKEIVKIRYEHGEAFYNFRNALNTKLIEARGINEPSKLKERVDEISFELDQIYVHNLKKEYKKIIKSIGIDALFLTGSLLTSFHLGNLTLLGAAGATYKGFNDYSKYLTEVKQNDAYFLWKLKQSCKRK